MDAGLLAGINLLQLDLDEVDTTDKVGATFGLYYNVELDPLFSVEVDVTYSYTRFDVLDVGGDMHRLGVPAFARLWFFPGMSVGLGPFVALNLEGDSAGASDVDAGAAASVSMKYPFGRVQAIFDARYLWGFADAKAGSIGTRELQVLLGVGYFM